MSDIEWYIPLAAIGLVVIGYYAGHFFRDHTHALIPFMEPLSYLLLLITLMPLIVESYLPDLAFIDPYDVSVIIVYTAFWVGYLLGYIQNRVDLVYISVHNIMEREQNIHPLVRYTNRYGQQCWQPQGFKEICKTLFFGIDNPLMMGGGRLRHVKLRKLIIIQEKDAIDVAGLEVNESEKVVFTIFNHPVKMRVEARKYTVAPQCMDSPYDWLVGLNETETLAKEYAELQVQASEAKSQITAAQIKGSAMVLDALAARNPSQIFIRELGEEFEGMVNARQSRKPQGRMPEVTADE